MANTIKINLCHTILNNQNYKMILVKNQLNNFVDYSQDLQDKL